RVTVPEEFRLGTLVTGQLFDLMRGAGDPPARPARFGAGQEPIPREGVLLPGSRWVACDLRRVCDWRSKCSQPSAGLPCPITRIASPKSWGVRQRAFSRPSAGVERAGQTLRNLEWFEVSEIRGQIADG